jgi:indole-3-glycerol phosphate synthase
MTILDEIIAFKRKEVAQVSGVTSYSELERTQLFKRECIPLSLSILNKDKTGIIAEFKRKSPSKGVFNSTASVVEIASGYFREGASGISILTDNQFFGGSADDLLLARDANLFPILRKDFIIDEYQVIESKAIGADAILLIAAVLKEQDLLRLARLARSVGLEVLLEIHDPHELDAVNQYVNIIGVNNRNLRTFVVNTDLSEEMAEKIPQGYTRISESGLTSPEIIHKLIIAGYNGFLIGEKFMSDPDPVEAFARFVKTIS